MQSRSIRRSGQPVCAIALSNASFWSGPDPRRTLWPAALCASLKGRTHGWTDQCCLPEESSCQLGAIHTSHHSRRCKDLFVITEARVAQQDVVFITDAASSELWLQII